MQPNRDPLVTVIMCVYNAGAYLRPAVQSVLEQTYSELEILIVDDGSTDACVESIHDLRDSRLRIIRQENRGKPAAMNVALDQMRGEFYAMNDADDLSHPRRVEMQIQCLLANPHLSAVFGGYELLLEDRVVAPLAVHKDEEACRRDIARFVMPSHDPTAMYRTSLVRGMRYDPDLPIVEGYDYILRLGELHPMRVLGECLYTYRIHASSVTRRNPDKRDRLVHEVIRRACARRGLSFEELFPQLASPSSAPKNRYLDNNLAAHFMDSVRWQRQKGSIVAAIQTGLQCVGLHPTDPHYWKALAYAMLPQPVVNWVRHA